MNGQRKRKLRRRENNEQDKSLSGNMVHNLRLINFRAVHALEWAKSANKKFKDLISAGEHDKLIKYENLGGDIALAIPTASIICRFYTRWR